MKKISLILLLFLFIFLSASDAGIMIMRTRGGGGACDTTTDYCGDLVSGDGLTYVGKYSGWAFVATKFVKSSTETICKIDVFVNDTGNPPGDCTIYIYTHDGTNDEPQALVTGDATSNSQSCAFGGTSTVVTFDGLDVTLSDGVTYWVVMGNDYVDGSNFPNWEQEADTCGTERVERSADASDDSWTNVDTTFGLQFELYK